MRIHFDGTWTCTEHQDAALVALLACHRELETIDTRKTSLAAGITNQPETAKGYVPIEQFDIHLLAMLPHRDKRPFANAVGVPQPGASREQQEKDEQVAERHHGCGSRLAANGQDMVADTFINSPAKRREPSARPTPSSHRSFHARCRRKA